MTNLSRIMSYDTSKTNQENCNCVECVSIKTVENQTVEIPKLSEEEIEQIIYERYSDKDEKTKTFIRKALKVHGDKYDYSKSKYINYESKLEIICKEHGSFMQSTGGHITNKNNCPKCKGGVGYTTEEYIKKAKEIHGDKYDYSKVNYVNYKTDICIVCKKHGEFWQRPDVHLRNGNCTKCANDEKLLNDRNEYAKLFIEKAKLIHGDKYDYSKVNYINSTTEVEIICSIHGSFWQKPSKHLSAHECNICNPRHYADNNNEFIEKCKKVFVNCDYDYSVTVYKNIETEVEIICNKHGVFKLKPLSILKWHQKCPQCIIEEKTNSFIQKAKEIHGDKYDYSEAKIINNKDEVKIYCTECNDYFYQLPNNHLKGCRCSNCYRDVILTNEEFIKRARKIHGNKYDYSQINYINRNIPIKIICKKHGEFWQSPSSHLRHKGCSKCKSSHGEQQIRNYLSQNQIIFEEQKRFEDCRNINTLPFDFYLPQYNLCIEFDGIQHFIPYAFDSKMTEEEKLKNFKQLQFRDQIKNEYCKNNNINLLRIRYDENVEEKLMEYFKCNKILDTKTIFDL